MRELHIHELAHVAGARSKNIGGGPGNSGPGDKNGKNEKGHRRPAHRLSRSTIPWFMPRSPRPLPHPAGGKEKQPRLPPITGGGGAWSFRLPRRLRSSQ